MTWRPDNWEHTRSVWLEQNYTTGKMKQKTFEAGADALLEALFKLAQESPTKTFTIDSRESQVFGIGEK